MLKFTNWNKNEAVPSTISLVYYNLTQLNSRLPYPKFRESKGRFTHSMQWPCSAHAIPLPCRAAKGFRMCLSHLIYTVRSCLIHTCHAAPMPCSDHAVVLKATAQPSRDGRAVLWPWEERHGQSMAWARHGKCESDTTALCKSNGKDTF